MLMRLRWLWQDLTTRENELNNLWDRYFVTMWLVISILTIL